jgi:phosphoenolpyruvate---glycerone phosphotransferase subunit DhaK
MKKLINAVDNVVRDQLRGLAAAHPELSVRSDPNHVVRADSPVAGKVALVSGGGSGHEPMHAGFVGRGMLDGAVPGEVFTSPTPDQVLECAKAVNGGAGVLLLVKNYTGDVLNFETALELAHEEGVALASVLVDDDVAVKDSLYTAGRRGVAGTVIVEKIVGAAAERGWDLDRCVALANRLVDRTRSFGVALAACTVPAAGKPTFELPPDEVEFGVGIHGEPGIARRRYTTVDDLIGAVFEELFAESGYTRPRRTWDRAAGSWVESTATVERFGSGERLLVLVNGLGGTPLSELYGVYDTFSRLVAGAGHTIARSMVGNLCTSLDMAGFSITVVKLDDELTQLWDDPALTPAFVR